MDQIKRGDRLRYVAWMGVHTRHRRRGASYITQGL
jgi:hypothetical protein